MKKFSYLVFISLCFNACTHGYKQGGSGYEYKVIGNGGSEKGAYGNIIQFHLKQFYQGSKDDTLLGDTRVDYIPRMETIDSAKFPPAYIQALADAGRGDSVVIRISADSAISHSRQPPPYIKPGGYIYTTLKIINVFVNQDQADSAKLAELKIHGFNLYTKQLGKFEMDIAKNAEQIAADSKTIGDWLDAHKLQYTRGKWGTFVVTHDEGTGEKIAYDDVVAVNYVGKTFDSSKIFDSNLDPKFDHLGTYEVSMRQLGSVMPGITDALLQLRSGSKATIYIPSSIAYGKKGFLPQIKPNENIIYDIEVIKVITEEQALKIVSANRRRAEAAQRMMGDTLKKKSIAIPGSPFN